MQSSEFWSKKSSDGEPVIAVGIVIIWFQFCEAADEKAQRLRLVFILTRTFRLWTLESTLHGGRLKIGMFGANAKLSVRQRSGRSSPRRRRRRRTWKRDLLEEQSKQRLDWFRSLQCVLVYNVPFYAVITGTESRLTTGGWSCGHCYVSLPSMRASTRSRALPWWLRTWMSELTSLPELR